MKVKMVKMGMDIDETRNHRIRGIIPTDDGKYLFVEITQGNSVDNKYLNLSKEEYQKEYPYRNYVFMDFCFRVDHPKDYYDNYSAEFKDFEKHPFREYEYTNENIIKVLQKLNPNITDIELTNEHYIEKYCDEKGFYELYDGRLSHTYEPIEITNYHEGLDNIKVKFLYKCIAVDGTEYQEVREINESKEKLIEKYGQKKMDSLIEAYQERFKNLKIQKDLEEIER